MFIYVSMHQLHGNRNHFVCCGQSILICFSSVTPVECMGKTAIRITKFRQSLQLNICVQLSFISQPLLVSDCKWIPWYSCHLDHSLFLTVTPVECLSKHAIWFANSSGQSFQLNSLVQLAFGSLLSVSQSRWTPGYRAAIWIIISSRQQFQLNAWVQLPFGSERLSHPYVTSSMGTTKSR
jgi:hypothetical protein